MNSYGILGHSLLGAHNVGSVGQLYMNMYKMDKEDDLLCLVNIADTVSIQIDAHALTDAHPFHHQALV